MTRPVLAIVGMESRADSDRGRIELGSEDRLYALAAPIRDASIAMLLFAAGSLLVHTVLMAAAVVAARSPLTVPQQKEIAVEIVRDLPAPTPPKPPAAPKAEQAKPQPARPQPAPPAPVQRQAAPEKAKPGADTKALEAMQKELASLRAEQEALKAAQSENASGKALALPSIGGGDGDAVGYQQLVFSQLAKAKGDSDYQGQVGGTTALKFEMDAAGKLVRAEIVRSSGNAALDGQALDIIHRAAPFPPPPTDADRIVFANVNFVPPKPK